MTHRTEKDRLDLEKIRRRLAEKQGPQFWRSLDEVAETPEFEALLQREFPRHASEWNDPVSRRTFLKLMGASVAMAGLTGCTANPYSIQYRNEKMAPYVTAPEGLIPGKPQFYATSMTFRGFANGLLAEAHEGRPTKLEGNVEHPASLGATDIFGQAAILTMYDPDRSRAVLKGNTASTWKDFVTDLTGQVGGLGDGAGLRILSQAVTSPTLVAQLDAVLEKFPAAKWYAYEPLSRSNVYAGAQQAFGQPVETRYDFKAAKLILSLDADFLGSQVGNIRYARDFSDTRRVDEERKEMSRLYVAESTPSITGAIADHKIPVRASQVESVARIVAAGLGVALAIATDPAPQVTHAAWFTSLIKDLQANEGASLVLAGDQQPPVVHLIAHAINDALGNVGKTVFYTDPVEASTADQLAGIKELTTDIAAGKVKALLILGGNPAFDAPADLGFADQLKNVPFSVHLSLYQDETSSLTTWHVNEAHFLEAWSDARAFDGTASIVQPLINPLYAGKTAHEVVELLVGPERPGYDILREYWQANLPDPFEDSWQIALHDGLVANSAFEPSSVTLNSAAVTSAPAGGNAPGGENTFELILRPDPALWDGRFANNGWLQELPRPYTKLTWDNAALMSPDSAQELNLRNGDLVKLSLGDRSLQMPIWITPGHPDGAVTVHYGHGRTRAGRVGTGTGFNAYQLRTSSVPSFGYGLQIAKAGGTYALVSTQLHHNIDDREIVKLGTLDEFVKNPEFLHAEAEGGHHYSLRPDDVWEYNGNKWGMVIDTNTCIGCNACVVACQAENNSPVVGKDEVARGREMQWLRIDEYYEGGLENPRVIYQPMACQQCEKAPCEVVCPVAATVHDDEGINVMVYNRCVGTKYCSNNCPYKVRRYNFMQYTDVDSDSLKLMRNPEVTVRNRGVMEKCNYCLQRINAARIDAKKVDPAGSGIVKGDVVVTACQAACPTKAIVFGNLNDPEAEVVKHVQHPLNFSVLGEELNTAPRTTYLARLTNLNPQIATE